MEKLSKIIELLSNFYNYLLSCSSTYNLGIAISAFALIVAFIQVISSKRSLKIKIHKKKMDWLYVFGGISIFLTFISEFIENAFIFNTLGALSMITSIGIFIWLIKPMKKIKDKEIEKLRRILDGYLPNGYAHSNSETMEDVIRIFDNLLEISLKNEDVADLFRRYFTSKIFLNYFSQSGYVFSKTLDFLLKNNSKEVRFFFGKLFLTSLNNQNSYLNIFANEDIYPNTLDDFDIALLENDKIISLINDLKFSIGYDLNPEGQVSFLKIIKRYFDLIGRNNECKRYPQKADCEIKYKPNDSLVIFFFDSIKEVLGSFYRKSQQEKKEILDTIGRVLDSYSFCIDFNQKSEDIRKSAGSFLYDLYEKILTSYDLKDRESELEFSIRNFYTEVTSHGEDKISQNEFLEKLKHKIISEDFGCNIKGWYPAMILIYWQLFGFSIFSGNNAMNEPREMHIEILSELSKSFPKLYDGHIRNFYDNPNLPEGKEELLKKQGRKILDDFLLSYMGYDRDENSLSYYYGFGESINGGKIFLDKVASDNKIEVINI